MLNKTETNTELPQTMRSTLNNKSTTTERKAVLARGGLNAFFHFRQIFALDSVVV